MGEREFRCANLHKLRWGGDPVQDAHSDRDAPEHPLPILEEGAKICEGSLRGWAPVGVTWGKGVQKGCNVPTSSTSHCQGTTTLPVPLAVIPNAVAAVPDARQERWGVGARGGRTALHSLTPRKQTTMRVRDRGEGTRRAPSRVTHATGRAPMPVANEKIHALAFCELRGRGKGGP